MSKVYISHNNILSSLGFTSEEVVENIKNEVSGLKLIEDYSLLPLPFYSSIINSDKLNQHFKTLSNLKNVTRLERMMMSSLNKVMKASNISLNNRVGLLISTTKGNIDALDNNNPFPESRAYLSELGKQIQDFFGFKNEAIIVSNACVSGILSVAIAKRYIQQGLYDHVFIVSGDLISQFILSGFNSFQALSETGCQPYDKNRKGINLGEAAASVLVTKDKNRLSKDALVVLGESSCNDANHISGPSRTGEGLYRSINNAMKQAHVIAADIDFISAHGTATIYNDEMEAIAFNRANLEHIPTHSLKGYFGHTLGASGLVETIVGMHSLQNNTLYKTLGFQDIGVSQPINVIEKTSKTKLNTFIKTASGFGGCNTAVIFQKIKQ
ncbi:MAG: beta-ketoacyl synthase N-terminal-like domain-containing protein [Flavobacteriales bacterium]